MDKNNVKIISELCLRSPETGKELFFNGTSDSTFSTENGENVLLMKTNDGKESWKISIKIEEM
jgi:hypothetical protein